MRLTAADKGVSIETASDETLLSALTRTGVTLSADCGGRGTCTRCKIRLVSGELTPVDMRERAALTDEELSLGVRLACCARPLTDVSIEPVATESSTEKGKLLFPRDFAADEEEGFGVAFDIGTTTLGAMLVDLRLGEVKAATSRENPEGAWGADVISRIGYCGGDKDKLGELRRTLFTALNAMVRELAESIGIKALDIRRALAVGNTTMMHIFYGVDPISLAHAPFEPRFLSHEDVSAESLGLSLGKNATVSSLANIAGHVGADITGVLLASRITRFDGTALAIDIGTNGEIALVSRGRLAVCSTAAGPAFEGASISCGMRAAKGAITRVKLDEGDISLETVGDIEPVGICGSGLIDAAATLARAGVVDASGRILSAERAGAKGISAKLIARIEPDGRVNSFRLAKNVALTQKDIREVQLAKAAISAGMAILMRKLGITEADLDRVYVAGAFGSSIDIESALALGILPEIDAGKIELIGNAAGSGAVMALASRAEHEFGALAAKSATHVELSTEMGFEREFLERMRF